MKAFPQIDTIWKDSNSDSYQVSTKDGMDLRDYFAAKAMQGMTTWDLKTMHKLANDFGEEPLDYLANNAYAIADAMMEARKK